MGKYATEMEFAQLTMWNQEARRQHSNNKRTVSAHWHCWLGVSKSIHPVKNSSDVVLAWLSLWSKVQSTYCSNDAKLPPHHLLLHENLELLTFLMSAYPGCPGKEAVKWNYWLGIKGAERQWRRKGRLWQSILNVVIVSVEMKSGDVRWDCNMNSS